MKIKLFIFLCVLFYARNSMAAIPFNGSDNMIGSGNFSTGTSSVTYCFWLFALNGETTLPAYFKKNPAAITYQLLRVFGQFIIRNGLAGQQLGFVPPTSHLNQWHFVCCEWYTDSVVNAQAIYYDAIMVSSGTTGTSTNDTSGPVYIGTSTFLLANIEDFRVYARKLSQQEITNLYLSKSYLNIVSRNSGDPQLWYRMDDGRPGTQISTGAVILDYSANRNNGTFFGSTNTVPSRWLRYPGY